jgi:transmembrane sensor
MILFSDTCKYMRPPHHLLPLIEKYQAGQASPEEIALINKWYHSFDDSAVELVLPEGEDEDDLAEKLKLRLQETLGMNTRQSAHRFFGRWRIPAAAALVLALTGVIYLSFFNQSSRIKTPGQLVMTTGLINDIAPGGNRALLTLADGSVIILDSAANGIISSQGNIRVEKADDGLLTYIVNGKRITENDEAFYNTITTPRGGQYQVTLSDGTKVWLNAASSIRFPVLFTGKERKVEVTGETYFEVAKNPAMPFRVKAENSEVEVLGTHFNINAYTDEDAIRTTLLEGKVKVSAQANTAIKYLAPGQQSGISKNGNISVLDNADTEEAVAWINGRFQFKSAGLKAILRQVSRWYDVEVEYRGNIDMHFSGQLNRSDNVSKVFEKLKLTGEVNFKIEGRKIIVSR